MSRSIFTRASSAHRGLKQDYDAEPRHERALRRRMREMVEHPPGKS